MSRGSPLTTALFWLMFLVGGASLAVGLYLPPWLENRELHAHLTAARERVDALSQRLTALEVQIEHHKTDPAYVERLARQEFGITTEGRETVLIESAQPAEAFAPELELPAPDRSSQIESAIETASQTHPVMSLYLRENTRPIVLGMSLVLMVAAIALLGRSAFDYSQAPPPADEAQA